MGPGDYGGWKEVVANKNVSITITPVFVIFDHMHKG